MAINRRAFCLALMMFSCVGLLHAQEGHLHIKVTDINGQPIRGIRLIAVTPPRMPSKPTNIEGTTKILVPNYKEGKPISLELFEAPKNLILFPPVPPIPPSRCKTIMTAPPEPAEITLVARGQKILLQSPRAITTIVSSLLENTFERSLEKGVLVEPRLASLLDLASLLELYPSDIDEAIRARSQNSTETYEKGLLALYEQNYSEATKNLSAFVQVERKGNINKLNSRVINASFTFDNSEVRRGQVKPSKAVEYSKVIQENAAFFLGQAFYEQGKYSEAAGVYQRLVSLRPDDITILIPLATSLYGAGQYNQTLHIFARALELSRRESNRGLQAAILNTLGVIHRSMGQYNEALDLFIRSRVLSREMKNLQGEGISLINIGGLYIALGQPTTALEKLNNALAISRELGDKELELRTLSTIGTTSAFDLHSYEKAILYFEEALKLSRQLGDQTAESLNLANIAHVYLNIGEYANAERFFQQSIEIETKIFGRNHPNVAYGLKGLGILYTRQGKYDEAETTFKQVLVIEENVFGPEHPDLVDTLERLALVYSQRSEYSKAEALYKRALAIREKIHGSNGIEVASSLKLLAVAYYRQERYVESETLIKRALKIMETGLGNNHPDLIPILEIYELILQKTNRDTEAKSLEKRIVEMRSKSLQKRSRDKNP
jgi:tetratricopeptide (TPR) repeat protein